MEITIERLADGKLTSMFLHYRMKVLNVLYRDNRFIEIISKLIETFRDAF